MERSSNEAASPESGPRYEREGFSQKVWLKLNVMYTTVPWRRPHRYLAAVKVIVIIILGDSYY